MAKVRIKPKTQKSKASKERKADKKKESTAMTTKPNLVTGTTPANSTTTKPSYKEIQDLKERPDIKKALREGLEGC